MNSNEWDLLDESGEPVIFPCNERETIYYQAADARGWLHCYSRIRDSKGRFWAWTYKPVGRRKRGMPVEFKLVRARSFRRRRSARRCAEQRLGLLKTPYVKK